MCVYTCDDNRFEVISNAKRALVSSTNISTNEDEMKVLDNILFRCWQMGWLPEPAVRDDKGKFCSYVRWSEFNKQYLETSAAAVMEYSNINPMADSNKQRVVFYRRIWIQHLVSHKFTRAEIGIACNRHHSSITTAFRTHMTYIRMNQYTGEEMDIIKGLLKYLDNLYAQEHEKYYSRLKG